MSKLNEARLLELGREMVEREVIHCVSGLVRALALGSHAVDHLADRGLAALSEQAWDLCRPAPDWQKAAERDGWRRVDEHFERQARNSPGGSSPEAVSVELTLYADWQELCQREAIKLVGREICEHWIVSDWLAMRLLEKGQRVDTDFARLNIWGRTTSGQAIYRDTVIRDIVRELHDDRSGVRSATSMTYAHDAICSDVFGPKPTALPAC